MVQQFVATMGVWSWWIFAAILIGIEVLAPGSFFLWFGLAAIVVGAITMIVGVDNGVWIWQFQVLVFVLLALGFAIVGRRLMARHGWDRSERPDLNDRGAQLVGRHAVLSQPITEGAGRAVIGDTTWRVVGPDLPKGTKVRVVSADGSTLAVERVQQS